MKARLAAVTFVLALRLFAQASKAGEPASEVRRYWPQWRGPLANGVAPHADPPTEWSESKNIRWKVPGRGHATPAVWGDRVYVLTAVKRGASGPGEPAAPQPDSRPGASEPAPRLEDGRPGGPWSPAWDSAQTSLPGGSQEGAAADSGLPQDTPTTQERPQRRRDRARSSPTETWAYQVLALERRTGKTVWERTVTEQVPHENMHQDASPASPSPIVDDRHVYAHFGSRGLFCLTHDGQIAWQVDLGKMRTRNEFGEGSSPARHGDVLAVNWDHEGDDFIVALDARTGKELWRQPRDEPTSWSTPLVVELRDDAQVITAGSNRIRAYDLMSGKLVWECGGLTLNVIPSPVFADGLVYLMSGFRGHALKAIRVAEARGDVTDSPAIVWTYDKDTPYVPSPLLYDGRLYFLNTNRAILSCLDARDGKPLFGPQRLEGITGVYASPVGAGGHVYVVGRDGKTAVLKAGSEFAPVRVNELDDGFEASPAIAGDEILLRGREHLYCIARTE
jgi:outer membrane protein assembly factor BamB